MNQKYKGKSGDEQLWQEQQNVPDFPGSGNFTLDPSTVVQSLGGKLAMKRSGKVVSRSLNSGIVSLYEISSRLVDPPVTLIEAQFI